MQATPTVVALPDDGQLNKALGSIAEIQARNGPILAVGTDRCGQLAKTTDALLATPEVTLELSPAVIGVAMQLFAYHCARTLGRDIGPTSQSGQKW